MTAIKVVDYYMDLVDVPVDSFTPTQVNDYINQFVSEIQQITGKMNSYFVVSDLDNASPTNARKLVAGNGILITEDASTQTLNVSIDPEFINRLGNAGIVGVQRNEIPQGAVDGINITYTLAHVPSPAESLSLFYNGQLLDSEVDFTLEGNTINTNFTPLINDRFRACYAVSNTQWNEKPAGTFDGTNNQFVLDFAPNPISSLMLYYNGQLLDSDVDYSINGKVITLNFAPLQNDRIKATYSR